ncbi:hypothetical protein HED52_21540 [Ochrobactrum ciceri]|uniref:Uncharacterized protein n=1 Tax=Brucella ciceri TaxID=391287 RepID=A0ABX1DW57_9HYPH|nr:hypothetical protein [Brucella ciceri]
MNQLAKTEDFTTKATQQEMFECLTLLSGLRSRASDNDSLNVALYYIALEGVTRHGLQVATRNILQGSLGHPFLPDPPELRQECNKVMKPILDAMAWDANRDRILREQREEQRQRSQSQSTWTPESRARATEKWQSVKAAMQDKRDEENSYDAAMARLQAAAEANGHELDLETMKPVSTGSFKQAGKAA